MDNDQIEKTIYKITKNLPKSYRNPVASKVRTAMATAWADGYAVGRAERPSITEQIEEKVSEAYERHRQQTAKHRLHLAAKRMSRLDLVRDLRLRGVTWAEVSRQVAVVEERDVPFSVTALYRWAMRHAPELIEKERTNGHTKKVAP